MQKNSCARRVAAFLFCLLTVSLALAAWQAIWPEENASPKKSGMLVMDSSHAADGYLLGKVNGKEGRYKLRISQGEDTYDYDISPSETYEVFPLQLGSGTYSCTLYRNTSGKRYTQAGSMKVKAELTDENNAFLCPSQYVHYTPESPAVEKAAELCAGLTSEMDKVKAIRNFIKSGFTYDFIAALTIQESYLGDVDECFRTRKGLCQDLAVLTAAMLRSQGVPTQLVIGYAGSTYHAWNRVLIDGEFKRLDMTAELSGVGKDVVYTAERYY